MLALLLLLSAGAWAGYGARLRPALVAFNQGATRWAIGALLFIMGTKLARARGLFARDLGVLLAAVASAALLVAGLFALFLVLGLFRKGRAAERDPEAAGASAGHELAGVFWNLAWIVLGLAGYGWLTAKVHPRRRTWLVVAGAAFSVPTRRPVPLV